MCCRANPPAAAFSCQDTQETILPDVPVLFLKTDEYLVPTFYLIPRFAVRHGSYKHSLFLALVSPVTVFP